MADADSASEYDSKVHRVAERYGLDGIDDALVARRRADPPESLRDLARFFNHRVLAAAMRDAGMDPLDGEVENTHRLLTDDDVGAGMRTQARNRLEREGIDVDSLADDFVSYASIDRHLTERLGVERAGSGSDGSDDEDRVEELRQRVLSLQGRTAAVTERTLDQLRSVDGIAVGDPDVLVDITVSCADCDTHLPVREFFARNGCDCRG